MKTLSSIVLLLLLLPSEGWSQARKPSSIEELATYLGAESVSGRRVERSSGL